MKSALHRCTAIALPLILVALACGQVTGLSSDYQFDLVDGGSKADAAGDARQSDAPSSGDAASDAKDASAIACTAQETASALSKLTSNGTTQCKNCLASACCGEVELCTKTSDCRNVLFCKLDCTDQGDQRAQCQSRCGNGGAGLALYTSGIGACGGRACNADCGFP